jgi:replicative DNA helicase
MAETLSRDVVAAFPKSGALAANAKNTGTDGIAYRSMPHNIEAEQGLLGAVLINNNAFEKFSDFLLPEHFYDPLHQRLYDAMRKLIDRGQLANPVTLKPFFEQDADLQQLGGQQYLARLAASISSIINVFDYGRLIHDLYLRRQLIAVGESVVLDAYDPKIDASAMDQLEACEQKLFELANSGRSEGGFQPFSTALTSALKTAETAQKSDSKISGVPTHFIDLDKKLGGMHNSDLIILAGRPSMGKTALATNIAFNVARHFAKENLKAPRDKQKTVAFFSLEMSAEQLANRIIAEESGISSEQIRRGAISRDEFSRVVEAANELSTLPFFIDETPAMSTSALRTRARRLARQSNLGLIVVDYLQLMTMPGGFSKGDNRVQEISEISRSLKAVAKELHIPVIALSQLSRQVEMREDKRPQLSDLRESGSIEQDADVVMFVYREAYYAERAEPRFAKPDESQDDFYARAAKWNMEFEKIKNRAEVIIGKQRHGPIGSIDMHFHPATTKFSNYAHTDSEDPHY